MSLREFIFAHTTAQAGIAAIIGTACYPDKLPDPDKLPAGASAVPALVYRRISGDPSAYRSHSGAGSHDVVRIQFDCYAATGDQAAALAREVVKAWNGYKGGPVGSAFVENRLAMHELEIGRYREIVEVKIDYEVIHE